MIVKGFIVAVNVEGVCEVAAFFVSCCTIYTLQSELTLSIIVKNHLLLM